MYDSIGQRILTGNTIQLPEYDDDDDSSGAESGRDVDEDAQIQYMFQIILGSIGTDEFKQSFLSNIETIKETCTYAEQRRLCEHILYKIKEVYDYESPINIEFESDLDIWSVYNFISFLEYNHKNFLIGVWRELDPDLKLFEVEVECKLKEDKVISLIENMTKNNHYPKTIELYLRTNSKENLLKWFTKISIKEKNYIKFELLKNQM